LKLRRALAGNAPYRLDYFAAADGELGRTAQPKNTLQSTEKDGRSAAATLAI